VDLEFPTSLVVKVQCMLATSLEEPVRILGVGNAHNGLVWVFGSGFTTGPLFLSPVLVHHIQQCCV
jgi:hypothetical protein